MKKFLIISAIALIALALVLFIGTMNEEEQEKEPIFGENVYEDLVYIPQEGDDETVVYKEYRYMYLGKEWYLKLEVPQYRLDSYYSGDIEHYYSYYNLYYYQKAFVKDEYVRKIVKQFEEQNEGDRQDLARSMVYFVQEVIEYELDEALYGISDYQPFPIECFMNGKGDCEGKAYLLNCLLYTAGFDVCTIAHNTEGLEGHASIMASDIYPYTDSDLEWKYSSTYAHDVSIEHDNKTYYLISSVGLTPGVGWYYIPWTERIPDYLKVYTKDTSYFYKEGMLYSYRNCVTNEQVFCKKENIEVELKIHYTI